MDISETREIIEPNRSFRYTQPETICVHKVFDNPHGSRTRDFWTPYARGHRVRATLSGNSISIIIYFQIYIKVISINLDHCELHIKNINT